MTPSDSAAAAPGSTQRFSIRNVLMWTLPLALIVGGVIGYLYYDATRDEEKPLPIGPSLRASVDTPEELDARFTDANNDLVADPPSDTSKLIDPPTLLFSTLGDDVAREDAIWADFIAHLKKVTGKDVKLVAKNFNSREQASSLADGEAHIAQLSTGNVPVAVAAGGYVPVCVMADADGKWGYRMEIIAPAGSAVRSLQDLRGTGPEKKGLALANLRSHSGFKAPLVTLWTDLKMLPERDYKWLYAGSQGMVVQRVEKNDCDAAAVASDFLRREIAAGKIAEADFRTIYTSPTTFPPSGFGYVHHLKPELAEKIRQGFMTFPWAGTSLEKAYKPAGQTRFVAINYKDDWAPVRDVEMQMKKLIEHKD